MENLGCAPDKRRKRITIFLRYRFDVDIPPIETFSLSLLNQLFYEGLLNRLVIQEAVHTRKIKIISDNRSNRKPT